MNVLQKLSLAVVAIGIIVSTGSTGYTPVLDSKSIQSVSAESPISTPEVSAPNEHLLFEKPNVQTIAAPPKAVAVEPTPAAPAARKDGQVSTAVKPPVGVTVDPVAVQSPVSAAPAVSREVYVGLAGGQSVVDLGRGPVLWPLSGIPTPYVAEHDSLGGWDRFGTLSAGMTVRMSGLVTGTYTVGQIINVPKGGTTAEFLQFSAMPKVMLQTCVPGTSRMIIVGLY